MQNAVFLTPELVFVLYTRTDKPKQLFFQLFKFNKSSTLLTLSAVDSEEIWKGKGLTSGEIKANNRIDNNIYVDKIHNTEDQIIFIFNAKIEMLRFSAKDRAIQPFDEKFRILSDLYTNRVYKGVSLNFGDKYILLVVNKFQSSQKSHLKLITIYTEGSQNTKILKTVFSRDSKFQIKFQALTMHVWAEIQ